MKVVTVKGEEPRVMPDNADTLRFIYQYPINDIEVACAECPCVAAGRTRKQLARIMSGDAGIPEEFRGYTFETWDALPQKLTAGKELARQGCELFAEGNILMLDSGEEKYGMVLAGDFGTGKSGLASATAMERARRRGSSVLWIDMALYVRRVRATYRADSLIDYEDIVSAATNVGLLLFDDFGDAESNRPISDNLRSITYDVIGERFNEKRPVIITTNLTQTQMLDQFGSRLVSRILKMCVWLDMGGMNVRNANEPLFNRNGR